MAEVRRHLILLEALRTGDLEKARDELMHLSQSEQLAFFMSEMRKMESLDCYRKMRDGIAKDYICFVRLEFAIRKTICRMAQDGKYARLRLLGDEIEKCGFISDQARNRHLARIRVALDNRLRVSAKPRLVAGSNSGLASAKKAVVQ